MLDDVGLIHMNGRLYDAALGRMCGADSQVQAPELIQNYNRYSYVLNNPMNATDPSGHSWLSKLWKVVVVVIIAVIIVIIAAYALAALAQAAGLGSMGAGGLGGSGLAGFIAGSGVGAGSALGSFAGINGAIWAGAVVGAAWSAINTAIQGGSFSQILKSAVIGAANGAVGAMVGGYMHGLGSEWGSYLAKGGNSISGTVKHLAAHGVAGGAMSEANGGSFRDGFIGGLIGAGASGIGVKLYGNTALYSSEAVWAIAGRTAISAVTGGLSSMATGGKFADGAYSAAFFHLFNNEAAKWNLLSRAPVGRTVVLYDGSDPGVGRFQDPETGEW